MLQRMVVWLGRRAGNGQLLKPSHSVRKIISVRLASSSAEHSDSSEVQKAREAALAQHQQPTIFSKILSKEIPADIIHEDEIVKHLF